MLEAARQLHERNLGGIATLESRLSFRLAVLQRMLDRQLTRLLARHGMSIADYRIMLTVDAFGEISNADLVRMVVVDKALVSRRCKEMIGEGLLVSAADPANARRRLLSLTPAGQARLAEVEPEVAARNAALDGQLDAAQRTALDAAITRLSNHAAQALAGSSE